MTKLEAEKGTVLDSEEYRRLKQDVDRELARAARWDRIWMQWTRLIAVLIGVAVLAFEGFREWVIWSRYANPGDRFLFDSRPGDFCSINYDQWIVRLGRDFSDEDEQ